MSRRRQGINVVLPFGPVPSSFQDAGLIQPVLNPCAGRPTLLWSLESLLSRRGEEEQEEESADVPGRSGDNGGDEGDTLWLARRGGVPEAVLERIRAEYPALRVEVVALRIPTQGAAETLLACLMRFGKRDLEKPVLSVDSGVVVLSREIITKMIERVSTQLGVCFVFEVESEDPSLSYVSFVENTSFVGAIKEKIPFTKHANAGIYAFPSAKLLLEYCERTIDARDEGETSGNTNSFRRTRQDGLFVTSVISRMQASGAVRFVGEILTNERDFFRITKPSMFHLFIESVKSGRIEMRRKMRFCFDLETIFQSPKKRGKIPDGEKVQQEDTYSDSVPRASQVELIRELYKAGHVIILQTSRITNQYSSKCGTNIGALTFTQLAKYDIPFHEIYFGKPSADVVIDHQSLSMHGNIRRIIGWPPSNSGQDEIDEKGDKTLLPAREFNNIAQLGNHIVKKMSGESAKGEAFFYANIPDDIQDLFPALHDVKPLPTSNGYTITIDYISSVSYAQLSQMYLLTPGRIELLIAALHRIHNSTGTRAIPNQYGLFNTTDSVTMAQDAYLNYSSKLSRRFETHRSTYLELAKKLGSISNEGFRAPQVSMDAITPIRAAKRPRQESPSSPSTLWALDVDSLFQQLNSQLQKYEQEKLGSIRSVIHGDPVFSNVLLTANEEIRFIDMRGMLGNSKVSLGGDCVYDLAKVMQSLHGYDFVLLGGGGGGGTTERVKRSDPYEEAYLRNMQRHAFQLIRKYYPGISPLSVLLVTSFLQYDSQVGQCC